MPKGSAACQTFGKVPALCTRAQGISTNSCRAIADAIKTLHTLHQTLTACLQQTSDEFYHPILLSGTAIIPSSVIPLHLLW